MRSEDSDTKRRRISELAPIPEDRDPAARGSGDGIPAAVEPEVGPTAQQPRDEGRVRQCVQEIEQVERQRRRSRSPLPEVLRRQMSTRRVDEMPGIKGGFKESCIFYEVSGPDHV